MSMVTQQLSTSTTSSTVMTMTTVAGTGLQLSPAAAVQDSSARAGHKCLSGHPLVREELTTAFVCDGCGATFGSGGVCHRCSVDSFGLCEPCAEKPTWQIVVDRIRRLRVSLAAFGTDPTKWSSVPRA